MSKVVARREPEVCAAVLTKVSAKEERARAALDEKVRRFHEIQHGIQVSMWALGAVLSDIHLREDWRARGTYANFTAFVAAEIKIPMPSVHKLIGISQRFTEEQTRAYGFSRLIEIRQAPESCWPELLKLCETGVSVRALRSRVREIRIAEAAGKSRKVLRHANARGSTVAATLAAAEKRSAQKANALPQRTLTAQERSIVTLARRGPGDKAAKPARSIGQQPTGLIAIDVVGTVLFSLFEGEGGTICIYAKFSPEARAS